jgi:hypothetical protein
MEEIKLRVVEGHPLKELVVQQQLQ